MVRSNPLFKALDSCLVLLFSPLYLLFRLFPRRKAPPEAPARILVVKLCCFGDSLLSMPALAALKTRFPAARVTVLAGHRTAALFERSPAVDEVRTLPVSGLKGAREFSLLPAVLREFLALRRCSFDCLLDFDVYYRFTTLSALLCSRAWSAGFDTWPGRAGFYHAAAERPRAEAEWLCFFRILAPLGVPAAPFSTPVPLRLNPAERDKAARIVGPRAAGEIRVGIVPGGSRNWPEKRWPLRYFAELMRLIRRERKARFFLFGVKEELNLAGDLLKLYGGSDAEILAGRTPFGEMAALVREMDLFLSNDTGPMHLAAMSGVPTVGIFGPTGEQKWTPPGPFRAVSAADCPCRPCYYLSAMPECGNGFRCLEALGPETAFKAVAGLLEWR